MRAGPSKDRLHSVAQCIQPPQPRIVIRRTCAKVAVRRGLWLRDLVLVDDPQPGAIGLVAGGRVGYGFVMQTT
jgi:hypothetical protein